MPELAQNGSRVLYVGHANTIRALVSFLDGTSRENIPRIHIPGRTFPVTDFRLEDVLSMTGYIPSKRRRKGKHQHWDPHRPQNRKTSPWADSERSDDEENDDEQPSPQLPETSNANSKDFSHSIPIEELIERVDETAT